MNTLTAQPDTDHLREHAPGLPDDACAQRLAMLADYLENSVRHCQSSYLRYGMGGDTAAILYASQHVQACAAGMAVLMFAHPDTEMTAAGGVTIYGGSVIGTDHKAAALLGISMECARSLFAGCAPPDGVIAMLRKLAQGENALPIADWTAV